MDPKASLDTCIQKEIRPELPVPAKSLQKKDVEMTSLNTPAIQKEIMLVNVENPVILPELYVSVEINENHDAKPLNFSTNAKPRQPRGKKGSITQMNSRALGRECNIKIQPKISLSTQTACKHGVITNDAVSVQINENHDAKALEFSTTTRATRSKTNKAETKERRGKNVTINQTDQKTMGRVCNVKIKPFVKVDENVDVKVADFTTDTNASSKSSKARPRQHKGKPHSEDADQRQRRLAKDRARKKFARKNETPEKRRARLDYYKNYIIRKSQAKGKKAAQNHNVRDKSADPLLIDQNVLDKSADPLLIDQNSQAENIEVKVEPVDYDGCTASPFDPPPNSDPASADKFTRAELPYTIQGAIVSKMFKGRPADEICKLYNTTVDVVNEIWEHRDEYEVPAALHKFHKRWNNHVEEQLLAWIRTQKDNHVQVSGKMAQFAAEGFAKEMGFVAFNGSRKWLDRFKKKHDIVFRTRNRDYSEKPDNKVKTQFFVKEWAEARQGLADDDIYVADEVGLFYNPSKNRIQKLRGKKFVQGCVKDRLSIFLCANASGGDKRTLVVCGSDVALLGSQQSLPLIFEFHPEAQFTTRWFEDYVISWDKELGRSQKKALLILDRATIHTKLYGLRHLKLLFVPYKLKSSLIPIRSGIFTKFRGAFRRLILQDKVAKCTKGVDRNLTSLEAFSLLDLAWKDTPPDVINASFIATGYDVTNTAVKPDVALDTDEEKLCQILKGYGVEEYYTNLEVLDEYLTVEDHLLTGQGTNPSVFGGNHRDLPNV